jgi:hypothetical protein
MPESYSAFGLALRSHFPLPGMAPWEGDDLPSLELALEPAARLGAAWSGPRASAPWRGRLGDGEELTIEWGVDGDLLFGYGHRAQFRLDPTRARLECAPEDPVAPDWQRVLLSRILPNVSLAHGRECLHAGAVQAPSGVVAFAAPTGMGKSTLASELVGRGWRLFADDAVVLTGGEDGVVAHPGSPHMNLADEPCEAIVEAGLGIALAALAGEHWVALRDAVREPRGLAAVVLLERAPGLSLEVTRLSPSPLALAPYMLGLPDEERDAANFTLYSDLVESTALLRLTVGTTDRPARLADALEHVLALPGPLEAGAPR